VTAGAEPEKWRGAEPKSVRLVGYPVQLGLELASHVEDWMREFQLMGLAQREGTARHDVPDQLQEMVRYLTTQYDGELSGPDRERAEAARRGEETVDLVYPVLPATGRTVLAWQQMTSAVDEFCRFEALLTLQRTREQVAFSDWVCGEFLRQLAGEPPVPWAEYARIDSR
jgi:hypothetical protein